MQDVKESEIGSHYSTAEFSLLWGVRLKLLLNLNIVDFELQSGWLRYPRTTRPSSTTV
jgi:hypothetical protein